MSNRTHKKPAWLYTLSFIFFFTLSGLAEERIWTSQSGATVKAEFVEVSNGMAVLKTAQGATMQIPIHSLSEADQKVITDTQTSSATASTSPSSSPGIIPANGIRLPAFASGEHRNLFAVYTAKRYRASVNRFGIPTLTFFNPDGSPSPNTAKLVSRVLLEKSGGASNPLRLQGWKNSPAPAIIADQMELTSLLEHGVEFTVQFHFTETGIEIRGWSNTDDVDGGDLRIDLGLAFNPLSPDSDPTLQELVCFPERGKDVELQFGESWNGTSLDLEEARVTGPAWGGMDFVFNPGNIDNAPLRGWIYPGTKLQKGFMLFINKSDADSQSDTETFQVHLKSN